MLVTLAQHRRAPGIRGVARMRIEADTPGRRLSYFKRRTQIEIYEEGFAQIARDALRGEYHRPMNTARSEEHTSELQSLMRISYAVFCLKTKKHQQAHETMTSN